MMRMSSLVCPVALIALGACFGLSSAAAEPSVKDVLKTYADPVIVAAPGATQPALRNYIGSVSADAGGGIVAAYAPTGGLITYWDIGTRQFLGSCELNDGCGIAPTRHKASFLLTSGQGVAGRNRR